MKKENKSLVTYIIGGILIVGVAVWAMLGGSGDNNGSDNGKSDITVSSASALVAAVEDNFDFGAISMKDGDVIHNFEIKNMGSEPVIIKKIYTSCACTTAFVTDASGKEYGKFGMPGHKNILPKTKIEVKAGESVILKAVYDPAKHGPAGVGMAKRSIYVESNSSKTPKIEFQFTAMVSL